MLWKYDFVFIGRSPYKISVCHFILSRFPDSTKLLLVLHQIGINLRAHSAIKIHALRVSGELPLVPIDYIQHFRHSIWLEFVTYLKSPVHKWI